MAGSGESDLDRDRATRFRSLALPYLDDVYTLARYLTGNATDAEDAAQDCYLRALRHFDSYRGPDFKPWLFAILRNVVHGARARAGRLVLSADPASDEANSEAMPLWVERQETPEGESIRQCDAETLRNMVAALPDQFREVIVLREISDMGYRDIATVTGVPIGTVMSRLARARAMLRQAWLAAEAKEPST